MKDKFIYLLLFLTLSCSSRLTVYNHGNKPISDIEVTSSKFNEFKSSIEPHKSYEFESELSVVSEFKVKYKNYRNEIIIKTVKTKFSKWFDYTLRVYE